MSLVQHLYRPGPVRAWWAQRAPGLRPYADQLARYANRSRSLSTSGVQHAAQVGGIVGRLLESLVEPAPPYAAILAGGMRSDAHLWPTHAHLAGDERVAAVEYRPTPNGVRRLVPAADRGQWSATLRRVAEIETTSPDDLTLARAAGAVTALETAYRSGGQVIQTSASAIEDGAAIVAQLTDSLTTAERLCGGQLHGHAAPTFAAHWADGDLLLGPGRTGGYGLIDVKTVGAATLRDPAKVTAWFTQLLSYAACDIDEDLWRVRAVGIWLPRQDVLMAWPLQELWAAVGIDERALSQLTGLLSLAYRRDQGLT